MEFCPQSSSSAGKSHKVTAVVYTLVWNRLSQFTLRPMLIAEKPNGTSRFSEYRIAEKKMQ